jgi:hypothetical protein
VLVVRGPLRERQAEHVVKPVVKPVATLLAGAI